MHDTVLINQLQSTQQFHGNSHKKNVTIVNKTLIQTIREYTRTLSVRKVNFLNNEIHVMSFYTFLHTRIYTDM